MDNKNIIDEMETALMDRIADSLAKSEDYKQSVEQEGKAFDWLKNNLTDEALEKLNEYFTAACSTAYHTQKISYLQGMKDLFAFYKYLDGRSDKEKI
ncbi:MAG: hypothetical protein K2M91_00755 [Lachnospiraceae bacterium]|nr:hypothetical protein [Lachnospiraceae bacterium]